MEADTALLKSQTVYLFDIVSANPKLSNNLMLATISLSTRLKSNMMEH